VVGDSSPAVDVRAAAGSLVVLAPVELLVAGLPAVELLAVDVS
jgi:hypothetical protein